MSIIIVSRKNPKSLEVAMRKMLPGEKVFVADVTSKSSSPDWVVFSPFHSYATAEGTPHFQVPGSAEKSFTVEGAWQGLKVFEGESVDKSKFTVRNGKNLKRTSRAKGRGKVLGHAFDNVLLDYVAARKQIYLPLYNQQLDHPAAQTSLHKLVQALQENDHLILLDYETNEDVQNTRTPLSHASLVKRRLLEMV